MSDPTTEPDAPDPQEVVEAPGYVRPAEDPTDPEVTDTADPSYVTPAADAVRPTALVEAPTTDGAGDATVQG